MTLCTDYRSYVLGLSVRQIRNLVGFTSLYEFEDIIQNNNHASLIQIKDHQAIEASRKIYKAFKAIDKSGNLSNFLARHYIPNQSRFHLQNDYDLFFPSFNSPFELFALKSVEGWRDRSRYAACFINEVWERELKDCTYLLELLKDFDHIFVGLHHSVDSVSRLTGKPCTYLPIGIDALTFCPFARSEKVRNIDICNIGRRSDITHRALLDLAEQNDLFYYYDTVSTSGVADAAKQTTFHVKNHQEHRLLLANLLKHSRYFIANRAFINAPERTGGKSEIPSRFFEGAAAGTVMMGTPPETGVFKEYFDWEDAVVHLPFDAPDIATAIADLDAQPERVAAIRRNNVINALLKHDWLHRLQVVYDTFDLPPSLAMVERSQKISALVDQIQQQAPDVRHYSMSKAIP